MAARRSEIIELLLLGGKRRFFGMSIGSIID